MQHSLLNNVPELLNQQEHSDLCFRSLVWALSPTSTGLSGTKVFKHNNLEHRRVVKKTYDSEQKTTKRKARVEMRLDSCAVKALKVLSFAVVLLAADGFHQGMITSTAKCVVFCKRKLPVLCPPRFARTLRLIWCCRRRFTTGP